MKDDRPTVKCAYCGQELENTGGFSMNGYVGYHNPCTYEWDVKKWCKECRKPICQCMAPSEGIDLLINSQTHGLHANSE